MWECVKGSEADFEGAPDWCTQVIFDSRCNERGFDEHWSGVQDAESKFQWEKTDEGQVFNCGKCANTDNWPVIAQRRKVDDLQSRNNDANLSEALKEMFREVPGAQIRIGSGIAPGEHSGPVYDTVQRPAHYNQSGIECIDAIAAAVKGKSGIEAVLVGNVIKYLWRYELKGGLESLLKAQWYLEKLIQEKTDDKS